MKVHPTIRFRRLFVFLSTIGLVVSMSILWAGPASAVGTYVHRVCEHVPADPDGNTVDFCWGFDYSGSSNGNRIRAYAKITSDDPNADLEIATLRLGDGNGVIDETGPQEGTSSVTLDTPLNYSCHTGATSYYNVHAWFYFHRTGDYPINLNRYADGWASVGSENRACTDYSKTYYFPTGSPGPPSGVRVGGS